MERLPIVRNKTNASEHGATLLEMIVYLGMLGMILTAATMFAAEFALSQSKAAATMEATRNARFALARAALEVREGDSITANASVFGSDQGVLTIATDDPGTDPTVIDLVDGVLRVTQGAGTAVPLTSSRVVVTSFFIENLSVGNKTKEVRMSLTTEAAGGSGLVELESSITLETTARIHKNDGFAP